jgi:hypothetical protein
MTTARSQLVAVAVTRWYQSVQRCDLYRVPEPLIRLSAEAPLNTSTYVHAFAPVR